MSTSKLILAYIDEYKGLRKLLISKVDISKEDIKSKCFNDLDYFATLTMKSNNPEKFNQIKNLIWSVLGICIGEECYFYSVLIND